MNTQNALMAVTRIFVLLVCFPVHECAHAWVADRLGDNTGRLKGRISLNPFRHLDFMGTVLIMLIGVGYAKPVPVNIRKFRHPKRDFALTAVAGPLSNLLMTVLFLVLIRVLYGMPSQPDSVRTAVTLLRYAAYINVSLAIFNLLPIPPLDGSRVLMAALPNDIYRQILGKERFIMAALLVAMMSLGRMGYSPVGFLTGNAFRFLYQLIVVSG